MPKSKYFCKLFNLEKIKQVEEYCKLREKEENGKGVHIRKCTKEKKKFRESNEDTGEVLEYEEFFYLVEWIEEISDTPIAKKKKDIFS
jgi:hypothetical protein